MSRAYECGVAEGKTCGLASSDKARDTAMTLARASGELFGLARDIMDCLDGVD